MTTSRRTSGATPEQQVSEQTEAAAIPEPAEAPPAPAAEPKYPTPITATREQLEALRAKLRRFH